MRTSRVYEQSLNDGRRVWMAGKRASSVTTHPGLADTVSTMSRLLDLHVDSPLLTHEEGGNRVASACSIPRSADDLGRLGRIGTLFAQHTLGLMGRLWDTSGSYVAGLYNMRAELAQLRPASGQLVDWLYHRCRSEALVLAVAFVDPPLGREIPTDRQSEVLRIVRRTSDGVFVSGAKTLCTGAAYADELLILRVGYSVDRCSEEQVVGFVVAPNTPGLSILCRPAMTSENVRSSLGAFDEIDACLVFDDAFIPNERILYAGQADIAELSWRAIVEWDKHCFVRRIATKLEVLFGLASLMATALGVTAFATVNKLLFDIGRHHATVSKLIDGAERDPKPALGSGGGVLADPFAVHLALHYALEHMPGVLHGIELLGGQSLVLVPTAADLASSDTGPLYERYLRGPTMDAASRARLMRFAAEMVASRFASRQRLLDYYAVGGIQTLVPQISAMLNPERATQLTTRFLEHGGSAV